MFRNGAKKTSKHKGVEGVRVLLHQTVSKSSLTDIWGRNISASRISDETFLVAEELNLALFIARVSQLGPGLQGL